MSDADIVKRALDALARMGAEVEQLRKTNDKFIVRHNQQVDELVRREKTIAQLEAEVERLEKCFQREAVRATLLDHEVERLRGIVQSKIEGKRLLKAEVDRLRNVIEDYYDGVVPRRLQRALEGSE